MSVGTGRRSGCAWLAVLLLGAGCRGEPPDPYPDGGRRVTAQEKVWAGRRIPELPVPAVGRPAVDWRRGRDARLVIGTAGVARGPARGPFTRTLFGDPRQAEDLRFLVASFAPFAARGRGSELVFHGRGRVAAAPAERRMILEWARLVELAAIAGEEGKAAALALSWQGEPAAGRCSALAVDLSGTVRGTCGPPETAARLAPAALARLYGWFDRLAPFQTGGAAAGRLIFAGRGARPPAAAERAELAAFAAALGRELDARSGRVPAPVPPPQGSEPRLPSPPAFPRLLRPAGELPAEPQVPVVVAPEVPPPPDRGDPGAIL